MVPNIMSIRVALCSNDPGGLAQTDGFFLPLGLVV